MKLNFDIEELAQKEVTRLVSEKLNKKLYLQIQKELKSYEYTNIIRQHTINEVGKLLKQIELLHFIDAEKLQKDVTDIIAKELIKRMTTVYVESDDDDYWD